MNVVVSVLTWSSFPHTHAAPSGASGILGSFSIEGKRLQFGSQGKLFGSWTREDIFAVLFCSLGDSFRVRFFSRWSDTVDSLAEGGLGGTIWNWYSRLGMSEVETQVKVNEKMRQGSYMGSYMGWWRWWIVGGVRGYRIRGTDPRISRCFLGQSRGQPGMQRWVYSVIRLMRLIPIFL